MSIEGWEVELVGIEKWDLMHMHWGRIHQMRGAKLPSEIIGYEYRDDEDRVYLFVCAYHESEEYFQDWTPVTVKDTWSGYYQCERMGCELGYYQEPMQEEGEGECVGLTPQETLNLLTWLEEKRMILEQWTKGQKEGEEG